MILNAARSVAIGFLLLFAVSCTPEGPVAVNPGQERCAHCRMDVADMRFNTQLITEKGKRYHFDSIECMEVWIIENADQKVAHAYVKNVAQPDQFLEREKAIYVKSERLASPMGAYLAAYGTEEQAAKAIAEYGGRKINLDELKSTVDEWKHRMHDHVGH
jgi:copper chaperone NosL